MELVLVLVVISVVLAMTAPMLRGFFASRQTADAATAVLAMTRYARSQAVSLGQPCRLNFDTAAGTCYLTHQKAGAYVTIQTDAGRTVQMPEGSSVRLQSEGATTPPQYIQFYPSGRCDVVRIEIQGSRGEVFVVKSDSATESYRMFAPYEAQQ